MNRRHCIVFNKVGKELSEALQQIVETNKAGDVTPAISMATFQQYDGMRDVTISKRQVFIIMMLPVLGYEN